MAAGNRHEAFGRDIPTDEREMGARARSSLVRDSRDRVEVGGVVEVVEWNHAVKKRASIATDKANRKNLRRYLQRGGDVIHRPDAAVHDQRIGADPAER